MRGDGAQRRRRASVASRGGARRSTHSRAHASSQVQFLRRDFPVAAAARPPPRGRGAARRLAAHARATPSHMVPSHPGRERRRGMRRCRATLPEHGASPWRAAGPAPRPRGRPRRRAAPAALARALAARRNRSTPVVPSCRAVPRAGACSPPPPPRLRRSPRATSPRARRLPAQVGGPSAAAARLASRLPQGRWSDAESQVVKSAGRCR